MIANRDSRRSQNAKFGALPQQIDLDITTYPAAVPGDAYLIERLVTNLVQNAIRYNAPHGDVHIWVGQQENRPTLQVTNTGPHVPRDQISRLLQPFQQATSHSRSSNDRSDSDDGLGLGLCIVAAIAHAHDARLIVEPRPTDGLQVTVSFPATRQEIPHNARRAAR